MSVFCSANDVTVIRVRVEITVVELCHSIVIMVIYTRLEMLSQYIVHVHVALSYSSRQILYRLNYHICLRTETVILEHIETIPGKSTLLSFISTVLGT